jgi:DNA-nicking Smr family endonuclease
VSRKPSLYRSKRSSSRKSNVNYDINVSDRMRHSVLLSRVFEEADSIFAERRRLLNELAIKRQCMKPRLSTAKSNRSNMPALFHEISIDGVGGKPGKIHFPITVGEPDFLYRSSKIDKNNANKQLISIDLHGYSRTEAIDRLNNLLPTWMEEAMKHHPYTVNVDVICGGGSQLLSETVEAWIKMKKNVANRFW